MTKIFNSELFLNLKYFNHNQEVILRWSFNHLQIGNNIFN